MSIETTLYSTLSNASGVTALVSTRIYPQVAPDNAATPYITYQVIVGMAHNKIAGAPESERKIIQLNCISNTYSNAKAIAEACKAAINVAVGYLVSERDDYFDQTEKHRVMLDISMIG